jgi:hypothetical protein
VLWIFYEDLLTDLETNIQAIAGQPCSSPPHILPSLLLPKDFLGIPLDDELRAIALEQTSFQFMKVPHSSASFILVRVTITNLTSTL